MTPENFTYWLKGFFELIEAGPKIPEKLVLTVKQVEMIEKHLKSVFTETIMKPQQTIDFTTKEAPQGFKWPETSPVAPSIVTPWPFGNPIQPVIVTCGQPPLPPQSGAIC